MKTPICDFVTAYANKNSIRAHMPGHKGVNLSSGGSSFLAEALDVTEIDGADVLYHSTGIISKSQKYASKLFRSGKTIYSTEGSSLSIRAMVYLTKIFALSNNKKPLILAARNAHKSFVNACAVLDVNIEWLFSTLGGVLSCEIDLNKLEAEIIHTCPTAFYVTSPDYLGVMADIKSISDICKKHNVLLLVDNAHGAYLTFLDTDSHPLDSGADLCADSAHKTLPALTGSAYLHIGKNAPTLFFEQAENAMSIFASTSPSYLILQTLDKINGSAAEIKKRIKELIPKIMAMRKSLTDAGFVLTGDEPLKITICPKSYGYTGLALEKLLKKHNIFCEFADKDFLVLMFSCNTKESELLTVTNVLVNLKKRKAINELPPKPAICKQVMSPNQAIFAPCKQLSVDEALGKIIASPTVSCPPAIPIVVCGEEINENAMALLKYYNIEKCVVVDK